jgi:hypothetical protein
MASIRVYRSSRPPSSWLPGTTRTTMQSAASEAPSASLPIAQVPGAATASRPAWDLGPRLKRPVSDSWLLWAIAVGSAASRRQGQGPRTSRLAPGPGPEWRHWHAVPRAGRARWPPGAGPSAQSEPGGPDYCQRAAPRSPRTGAGEPASTRNRQPRSGTATLAASVRSRRATQ